VTASFGKRSPDRFLAGAGKVRSYLTIGADGRYIALGEWDRGGIEGDLHPHGQGRS
jgi:hypothetical protein